MKTNKELEEDPLDAFFRSNPKEVIHPDPEDYERDRAAIEENRRNEDRRNEDRRNEDRRNEVGNDIKFPDSEDEARYVSKHC